MKWENVLHIGIIITLPAFAPNVLGQISQGGVPYSIAQYSTNAIGGNLSSSNIIPTIEMPFIDQSIIKELKEYNNKEQDTYQFAYSFDVCINVKESAIKDSIDCGVLYRLAIHSAEAYSINIIFSEYHVPSGATLFMYNEKLDHVIGAFTSNNNKTDKILAVSPITGEKIILEYFEPYFSDFEGTLIIEKVSHDFLDILNSGQESALRASGNCEVDINCEEGDDWQIEKRSVCLIMYDGNALCSGALINNTNNDGRAYFLTANHCVNTQQKASRCVFYFNHERPTCSSGNGMLSQSISGATLRATGYDSDFTLLELSKKPLSTFKPYFAGWDRNNVQSAGGVGIHHPAGDVKKISTFRIVPRTSDCFYDVPNANFYKINWASTTNGHGVTEGGSSGSPLFNAQKRIIGQLYGASLCSNTDCSNPNNDTSNYGKIFSSWNLGSTPSTRLRDWLDPTNSSKLTLDGIDACPTGTAINLDLDNTISSGSYQATNTIESTSIVQSGEAVAYNAGNAIMLKPGYHAHIGSQFHAKIENFNCVVSPAPINIATWTNIACIGSGLHFNVTNATNYSVKIYSLFGQLIYSGNGNITGNSVTIWPATGVSTGYYAANITFSSSVSGEVISKAYTILVRPCSKSAPIFTSDKSMEDLPNIQEIENNKFDFSVYPNPNNGNFTIDLLQAKEMKPYSVQIFNSNGILISKIDHCNTNQINFNHTGLTSGIYYIKLSLGVDVAIKRIIIK